MSNKLTDFISEFNRLIVDDNIKTFILGTDHKRSLKSCRNYLLYMENCITLSYIYAYSCYRQLTEYSEEKNFGDYITEEDNNSGRVLNSLKKTYVQYPLTAELVQFVILDLQFDLLPGSPQNLHRVFGGLCNFSQEESFNLVKYFNYIAKWRLSPTRFAELSNEEMIDLFLDLITNMTFLHGHLCKVDDDFAFMGAKSYRKCCVDGVIDTDLLAEYDIRLFKDYVPVRHTVIQGDGRRTFGFYYLCNLERKDSLKAVDLTYVNPNNNGNIFVRVTDKKFDMSNLQNYDILDYAVEDYYYEITGLRWDQSVVLDSKKKEKSLIDQVHTINYKYIKNLALSVSDAVSRIAGAEEILSKAFCSKHSALFKAHGDEFCDIDGLIIMLMIEESPTRVLEVLFSGNKQLFTEIVKNIDKRFADEELFFHNKSVKDLSRAVNQLIKDKLLISEHSSFRKNLDSEDKQYNMEKLRPMAQALLIVSSLSRLFEDERQNEYIYGGNVYANIKTLNSLKTVSDVSVKIEHVRSILIDTFKHLICFYEGVYAYGDKRASYDFESMNKCLSAKKIAKYQKELSEVFMAAAKKKAELFNDDTRYPQGAVFAYIDDFIAVCNRCYQSNNINERSYREKLYSAIGKYEIMDIDAFHNCVASCLGNDREITADNVDRWLKFALVIMEYLKTGSFSDTPYDHNLMDAVYPFAAAYSKRNENRDGQITVTFTISIDIDNDGDDEYRRETNVLTEFSYNLKEMFYCLPNVQRSNDKWWIDPVLISFTNFNSIFE